MNHKPTRFIILGRSPRQSQRPRISAHSILASLAFSATFHRFYSLLLKLLPPLLLATLLVQSRSPAYSHRSPSSNYFEFEVRPTPLFAYWRASACKAHAQHRCFEFTRELAIV